MIRIVIDVFKRLDQWLIFVMEGYDKVLEMSEDFTDEASVMIAAQEYQAKYGGEIEVLTIGGKDD